MAELRGNIPLGPVSRPQTGIGSAEFSNSLSEPVETRDLRKIGNKLKHVLLPHLDNEGNDLRDWDLWGPLFLCLLLALTLSVSSSPSQSQEESASMVFALVFVIVWVGAAIVTLNAQLLGAPISFFQSVCVVGYCLCPINVAAAVVMVLAGHLLVLKLAAVAAACFWSTKAAAKFVAEMVQEPRRPLALYPVFLFYVFLGWFVVII